MIDTSRICVIDFETTGFKQNAPVFLAVAFYENNKRTYAKYILINPEAQIEAGAYKVHGISQVEAETHDNFSVVWKEIRPYFENSIIVAHNAQYDVEKVLIPTLKRYNIPVPTLEKLCTRDNARAILPKQKSYTLDALCDYFGIDRRVRLQVFHQGPYGSGFRPAADPQLERQGRQQSSHR